MKVFTPFAKISAVTRVWLAFATAGGLYAFWLVLVRHNAIIPTPFEVGEALVRLLRQSLLVRLWESYVLNLEALVLSTALSFGLAYLTVIPAVRWFVRALTKLRFLGFTGIAFLFGMYAEDRLLQVWMLVFGISTFFLTAMVSVVASVPESQLDYARTLRLGPWRTTYEIVIRGTLDQALDSLRQNAAMGWVMLTMVEGLVRSRGGVGVLLIDLNRKLDLAAIFAVQILIILVGMGQDWLLGRVRLGLCPHVAIRKEG